MEIKKKNWSFLTELNFKRSGAASVEVDDKLFVTGGLNNRIRGDMKSTEFISLEGDVSVGPDLPSPRSGHCMIKLPSGKMIILGGDSIEDGKSAIVFDIKTKRFQDLPSLKFGRVNFGCAVFNSALHNYRQ